MMAMTTSSSIRVKPRRRRRVGEGIESESFERGRAAVAKDRRARGLRLGGWRGGRLSRENPVSSGASPPWPSSSAACGPPRSSASSPYRPPGLGACDPGCHPPEQPTATSEKPRARTPRAEWTDGFIAFVLRDAAIRAFAASPPMVRVPQDDGRRLGRESSRPRLNDSSPTLTTNKLVHKSTEKSRQLRIEQVRDLLPVGVVPIVSRQFPGRRSRAVCKVPP